MHVVLTVEGPLCGTESRDLQDRFGSLSAIHRVDQHGGKETFDIKTSSYAAARTLCTTETPQPAFLAILSIPKPWARSSRMRSSTFEVTAGRPMGLPLFVPFALARARLPLVCPGCGGTMRIVAFIANGPTVEYVT